ncbi:STAS domain-containing protein [Kitasatospora kazusensis]|uniref:Anti-sigma factor antagonist n=1 Tax=Kitasatospora kazusensis TaxID=407974 RepID=A0ABN3A2Q0_9ACTN
MQTQNDPAATPWGSGAPGGEATARVRAEGDRALVCVLQGELDIESLAAARRALTEAVARSVPVLVVDLHDVGFCDSTGLNLLLRTRTAAVAAGTDFRLAAPSPAVLRLLEITGADSVFSLHPSLDDALNPAP